MKIIRMGSMAVICLLVLWASVFAVQAMPDHTAAIESHAAQDCIPGTGWKWVDGPEDLQAAEQARQALARAGVAAEVTARGYGEVDMCDQYFPRGVDLFITLPGENPLAQPARGDLEIRVRQALETLRGWTIGNVKVNLPQGETITLHFNTPTPDRDPAAALSETIGWKLVNTPQQPSARMLQGMAFDSQRGKVVLFGGDDSGFSRLSDTWEYDGGGWVQKSPAHSPAGRVNIDQAMAFDALRNKVVLFGGLGEGQYLGDTWEYNGVDWSQVSPSQSPSARDAHAVAFDSLHGKTVLFGGINMLTFDDTWEYDGDWHLKTLAVKPPARFHHSMAYDSQRNVVVLFGGSTTTSLLNDTWEYDGATWKQVLTPQSPSVRENHSMTYDARRGVVVLFGGANNSAPMNDTWEYDGTTWTQVSTDQAPSPRGEMSLVYDSTREKAVLFGGGNWMGSFNPSNETWEYPSSDSTTGPVFQKKVYVVAYNPYVDAQKTQRLWDYLGWNSYEDITQGTIDFFKDNSGGQIRYSVVDTAVLDEFPRKTDGFLYTVPNYIDVIHHLQPAHSPDGVDYNIIVNDPRLDICGKANRGEIDEVWVFNGPYYGFWESTLVGPQSYFYNSPPVPGPFTCQRMIPIMGPNPERYISEHIEDFGHRTESTMGRVYNYLWDQNHTRSGWEKFALVDSLSPDYTYSGCGNVHFPPNGQSDYDWANPASAQTYCDDFANYPVLHDPLQVLKTVTCDTWGCGGL
ncbi:MAG TPA: kelch repeat-containing protein, partial [Anaerolinea sp.]|nr:kelch repeat-containing protein [Anaerolinea sp.]